MRRHFNDLTPAEHERLALLMEECGECVQVIGKILRHGYDSKNPNKDYGPTNRQMLAREIADILFAADLIIQKKDVDGLEVAKATTRKKKKVQQYLHHN